MNWQEYEALSSEELTHEAKLIYVLVLRRYMDSKTGIAGRVRRITIQCMREALEVIRPRGSHVPTQKYTSRQVRYGLELLEKHGLIQKQSEACVYRLVLVEVEPTCPDGDADHISR